MRRTTFPLFKDELGVEVPCVVLSIGAGMPHVILTALQHGNEILSLDAALQALNQLERTGVQGTITLLTCLNPFGFREGTRNFLDRSFNLAGTVKMNLNRQHPGNMHGSLVERVAQVINDYLLGLQPDYVIDLHAYSVQSVPHLIIDHVPDAMRERLQTWAEKSGLPYYHEFTAEEYAAQSLDNCLSTIWCGRGVPALTLEVGPQLGFGATQHLAATAAVVGTICAIGLSPLPIELSARTRWMQEKLRGKQWQRLEIENPHDVMGYVRRLVAIGTNVKKGEFVAEIVHLDGQVAARILAPHDGVMFIWHDDPRAYPGTKVGVMLKVM